MRTLYEINSDILSCLDMETGEILDTARLDALQLERDQKFENVGLWIKDMNAEITARKEEVRKQQQAIKSLEARIDGCKEWLRLNLAGEKFKTPRVGISYTHNQRVKVEDEEAAIDAMSKSTELVGFLRFPPIELRKDDIKKALKAGTEIPGLSLEDTESVVIR